MSYCWPNEDAQTKGNSEDPPYLVLEEDLTIRPIRGPKDIIDRAVDFAVQNGFRMVSQSEPWYLIYRASH